MAININFIPGLFGCTILRRLFVSGASSYFSTHKVVHSWKTSASSLSRVHTHLLTGFVLFGRWNKFLINILLWPNVCNVFCNIWLVFMKLSYHIKPFPWFCIVLFCLETAQFQTVHHCNHFFAICPTWHHRFQFLEDPTYSLRKF